ncbi:uncharacterized protein STEHIDRAFT_158018 [Stereum hirsutum FP-91666 SS1]|uniref:uncharacterized protein n=1 Tax=Stereum hirsutum (strain FP-91666) TaxID=721885 RepID=UPI00044498AD|nr:uncharacterized protein STEHIDRAFT_158018 [Stereum hirsutum FP-91666 SS1]EIM85383.1 hypothetical protein STEHIDRAFT_158018 [Stereum hirsutum FP-91666 SS1]
MSSAADLLQQIILEDRLWVIGDYTNLSAMTLWLVDFFDTLTMEIEAVWKGRITGTAMIFIVNRYAFAANLIVTLIPQMPGFASNSTVVFAVSAADLALDLILLNKNTSEAVYLLATSLTPYFSVLPNLLVNRLYLNLRTWNLPPASVSNHSALGEPAFAQNRFLGNIGEPLDPDWWNNQFDDGDDTGPDGNMADASETTDIGDRITTLVPVVYGGGSQGEIEMVPLQREPPVAGPIEHSGFIAHTNGNMAC